MTTAANAHRTAIIRGDLSRPTRASLSYGLINDGTTFFDYGCGRGEDIAGLKKMGITATGWDPHYRPNGPKTEADIVNLGFVVNVIADPSERADALRAAWNLTGKALIVSARLTNEQRSITVGRPHGDGFVTGHGAFQRFYSQAELRLWIDTILEVESIAVAPGIFVAFREEKDANEFLLQHRPRRTVSVQISRADRLFDENRELLDDLIGFYTARGRLPAAGEQPGLEQRIRANLRSYRRAWTVVDKVTETDWEAIATERANDVLADLALLKLNRRPNFTALPTATQRDIKTFHGSYKNAVQLADDLLFSAGKLELIEAAARSSAVGKKLPTALYVHRTALNEIPHLLRVYEGCARWLAGDVEGTTLIKLATDKPKVSYLAYPTFDTDPHPQLQSTTYVKLGALDVDWRDYSDSANPPLLHRKEEFVGQDYPLREKFTRLTRQEERFGLLCSDTRTIGNSVGWNARLQDAGVELRGHRVVRSRRA